MTVTILVYLFLSEPEIFVVFYVSLANRFAVEKDFFEKHQPILIS